MAAKRTRRRWLPVLIVFLAVSGLGGGAYALIKGLLSGAPGQPKKIVQEIKVIRPPPPPPDVPPPPPPPPEEKVDVQEPEKQPDPTPSDEPPPSEQLGLDAAGSAGGDAFGLAARQGGRDLLASGGSAWAWYSNVMQNDMKECLADDKQVQKGTLHVQLWLGDDGTVDRVTLARSTGDRARDKAIEADVQKRCPRISHAPPAGTPQPVTLRLDFRA
jgi:periplasmic protein TonB